MKNCTNCKHKLSLYTGLMDNSHSLVGYAFVRNVGSVSEDFYVKCANGHTEECANWWIENGGKSPESLTDMSCHEDTELNIVKNELYNKLDELSNLLNKE